MSDKKYYYLRLKDFLDTEEFKILESQEDGYLYSNILMKMYLISDNIDTWTGMRLAGVEGAVVHEKQELKAEIDKVLADKEIGILLLTEKFGKEFPDIIDHIRLERKLPLIVEIPDRHGTGRAPDFITSYVNEAIGINI